MNFHDAGQTVVWDVRPNFSSNARSHNDKEFPMHTDCAFENPPPRFIALYVVRQDRHGGGISRFVPTDFLVRYLLSPESLRVLRMTEFTFRVPEEFRKAQGDGAETCSGPIISAHCHWRYRGEIIVRELLTAEQVAALAELDAVLCNPHYAMTTRLPQDSLVILDNTKWFHGRSKIKDSARWLKRVRFHSLTPAADLVDFTRMESLVFFRRETSTATSVCSPLVLTAGVEDAGGPSFSAHECENHEPPEGTKSISSAHVGGSGAGSLRHMLLHASSSCGYGEPAVASLSLAERQSLPITQLLALFPIMSKSELFELVDAAFARRRQHAPSDDDDAAFRGLYWSPSGGTVGPPRYFPTNVEENRRQRQMLAPLFAELGALTKDTICANLFASNRMYRAQEILNDFIVMNGGTTLPIGSASPDEEVVAFARDFRANTICGMPPRLVQLASYMKSRHIRLPNIRHVLFGGEPLYEPKVVLLREVFGRGVSLSSIYGSAETGIWAVQPPSCHRDCYVYHPGIVHLQVVEPDEKGFGQLVVTNLVRTQFPVVRYDTGDSGRLEAVEGRPGVRLLGRRVQRHAFHLGSEYYTTDEIEQACPSFQRHRVVDYQLVLAVERGMRLLDTATFKVVLLREGGALEEDEAVVVEEIRREIESAIGASENTGTDGAVPCVVAVVAVKSSELVRTSTGGKTLRVIDQRQ